MATKSSHSYGHLSFKVAGLSFGLLLTSCSTLLSPGRKSDLADPIVIGYGDVVGWLPPKADDINEKPTQAVILFRRTGDTKVSKIRLVEGEERLRMRLINMAGHFYSVPMAEEGGPAAPGKQSSGVGIVTEDISLEVVGGSKRYLILRDGAQRLWEDTLPPAFYYGFGPLNGTQPNTQYRILTGGDQLPTITHRKP